MDVHRVSESKNRYHYSVLNLLGQDTRMSVSADPG